MFAESPVPFAEQKKYMSEGYWKYWNADEQKRIDADIEKYRKADAAVDGLPANAEVKVEQISHDFIFGAHIFNFDQLGSHERNEIYKAQFGEIWNSATIAFYWKTLEPVEGMPRFAPRCEDTENYWNLCDNPNAQPHWRRPATDPVVKFCEEKGIRAHGHVLAWGNRMWQIPEWLMDKLQEEVGPLDDIITSYGRDEQPDYFPGMSAEEIEKRLPRYTRIVNEAFVKRIIDIALRYRGRLQSWDVANESATDFEQGNFANNHGLMKSHYGILPGDMTYKAFKVAEAFFPREVKLNINDYNLNPPYKKQVEDLLARGCKIDIMGAQMHLFNPQQCADIAAGTTDLQSPKAVRDWIDYVQIPGLPIHLSEITITSPGSDVKGESIQSVIAYNLYRLWFSQEQMMGITWWNTVDGCGAPKEPAVSGIFHRDMTPKLAYFTLRDLITKEWRTSLTVKTDASGKISFRGFKGKYRVTWNGGEKEVYVK